MESRMKWHPWNVDRNFSGYATPTIVRIIYGDGRKYPTVAVFGTSCNNKLPAIELSTEKHIVMTWIYWAMKNNWKPTVNKSKTITEYRPV